MSAAHEVIELLDSSDASSSSASEQIPRPRRPERAAASSSEEEEGERHVSSRKKRFVRSSHGVRLSNGRRRKRVLSENSSSSSEDSEEREERRVSSQKRALDPKKARFSEKSRTETASSPPSVVAASRNRFETSRGAGGMREIAEGMSFSEFQAQEQAMARFQKQNQRRTSRPVALKQHLSHQTKKTSGARSPGEAAAAAARASSETRQLAEIMSFSELQAQEQAIARFQAQKSRKAVRPVTKLRYSESDESGDGSEENDEEWEAFRNKSAKAEARRRKKRSAANGPHKTYKTPVASGRSDSWQLEHEQQATNGIHSIKVPTQQLSARKSGSNSHARGLAKELHSSSSSEAEVHDWKLNGSKRPRKMAFKPVQQLSARKSANNHVRGSLSQRYGSSSEEDSHGESEEVEILPTTPKVPNSHHEHPQTPRFRENGRAEPPAARLSSHKEFREETSPVCAESNTAQTVLPVALHGTSEMHRITEGMSFSELQAQQQVFAYFRAQNKRRAATAQPAARKAELSGQNINSGRRRARMGVSQTETTPSSSSRCYVAPPSRNGLLTPTAEAMSVAGRKEVHSESSKPVIHSTAWRRLVFATSPPSILDGTSLIPYGPESDKPLWDFDPTGQLKEKCKFVDTVGQGVAITEDNFAIEPLSQQVVDTHVRELMEQELPYIKKCHARRVRHILRDTRRQVSEYLRIHQVLRGELYRRLQWSEIASHQSSLDVSPIERVAAKRMLQNPIIIRPYNSLVGDVRYFVHQDARAYETIMYPETVTHLANDITAIRRSFTMIGIRKNAYVEDDPILRYAPYLGDGEQLVIDNELYVETTMSKERRVAVFGEGEELKVSSPSVRDDEIMEYLLRIIMGECRGAEEVVLALQNELGFNQPRIEYCEMQKLYAAEQRTARRVAQVRELIASTRKPPTNDDTRTTQQLSAIKALRQLAHPYWFLRSKIETQSIAVRLQPPMSDFESNYSSSPNSLGLRDRNSYNGLVEWHRDLFCRCCYSYDCFEHGIQNPQRSHRADPINPMVTAPGIILESREKAMQGNDVRAEVDTASASSENPAEVIELGDSSSSDDEPVIHKAEHAVADHFDSQPSRRSRRAQTRISSMASASLQIQEKMQEQDRIVEQEERRKRREKFARAADNSEYLDDSYLPAVRNTMQTLVSKTQPCSSSCWQAATVNDPEASLQERAALTQVEAVLVRKLASTFGPNSCMVSAILRSPNCTCAQIFRFLAEEKTRRDSGDAMDNEHDSLSTPPERQQKHGRRQSGGSSGNRSLANRVRDPRNYDREKKMSYKPCDHDGVCDEKCECSKRGHPCNKACSCPRDCPNRFQGCKCTTGSCRTSSCPCLNAGRECDPDYCFKCGASDAAVMAFHPAFKSESCYDINICCNVNMLRGSIQKKVGVAFSATHGWGAFALEPIRKGEFVLEYTGELISDMEAERRGAIYDKKQVSYLFGVNSEYVVDAARKGNKAKFANHRPADKANMDVKIIAVNGEHRIGLFAREAIEVGAELFFDYGYTHDTAPNWSQQDQLQAKHKRVYDIVDDENEWEQW